MECILLGSGGMMPLPHRFLTALMVRLGGVSYLFDAGEGAQINLKRAGLGIKSLSVIAVSHLHADHCLGIPGLLMLRSQVPDPGPLVILGPAGIKEFISQVQRTLDFFINYSIRFVEWDERAPETAYEDEQIQIKWAPLKHATTCVGYRLEEHPRPGRFSVKAARTLGVPEGLLWGKLQRGESVALENGIVIQPRQVLGPGRPGRCICYAVDTTVTKSLYGLCRDVDMAFLDGMFHPLEQEEADRKAHMTVDNAARVAKRAGAKRAVLVHTSPRYREEDVNGLDEAAKGMFERAEIGRDLNRYTLSPSSDSPSISARTL
jgi:ribonuclease Z